MRTNISDLPPIDPTRTHLEILRDALELLKLYQPTRETRRGDYDCAECGFPLTGNVSQNVGKHGEFKDRITGSACAHVRAVAELSAWVRVEEQLAAEIDCL